MNGFILGLIVSVGCEVVSVLVIQCVEVGIDYYYWEGRWQCVFFDEVEIVFFVEVMCCQEFVCGVQVNLVYVLCMCLGDGFFQQVCGGVVFFVVMVGCYEYFVQCYLGVVDIEQGNGVDYFVVIDCYLEIVVVFLVEIGNIFQVGLFFQCDGNIEFFLLDGQDDFDYVLCVFWVIDLNFDYGNFL